jgi:lipoprotein-anchoring transpeptidase ErfK/SrfK
MVTELGAPEVYLVLARKTVAGEAWLQVRLPMRPNGTTGWVPETALTDLHVTYTRLVIDLGKRRATLFESGAPIWRAPIGIGKPGTPTPRGSFYIRQRLRLNGRGGVYGAFAFGTSAYSDKLTDWPGGGVIGIHGTNQPRLIPGRVSHGCIRVRNAQIRDLRSLMGVGTPVLIR